MPSDLDIDSLIRRVKAMLEELDDRRKESVRPLPKIRTGRNPRDAGDQPPTLAEALEPSSPQPTKPRRYIVSEPNNLSEELPMDMLRSPPRIQSGRKNQGAKDHPRPSAEAKELRAAQYTKPRCHTVSASKDLSEKRQKDLLQPLLNVRVSAKTKVAQAHRPTAVEALKLTLQPTALHRRSVLEAEDLLEELGNECLKMQLRTSTVRNDIFGELAKENQKEKSTLAIGRALHSKLPGAKSEEAKLGRAGDDGDGGAPDGNWEVVHKVEAEDEWTLV